MILKEKKKSGSCCGSLNPMTRVVSTSVVRPRTPRMLRRRMWKKKIWLFITTTISLLCEGTNVSVGAFDWQWERSVFPTHRSSTTTPTGVLDALQASRVHNDRRWTCRTAERSSKTNGRKLLPNLAFFLLLFFFNLMRRKSFCFGFSLSLSFTDPKEHKELISMPCLHS